MAQHAGVSATFLEIAEGLVDVGGCDEKLKKRFGMKFEMCWKGEVEATRLV